MPKKSSPLQVRVDPRVLMVIRSLVLRGDYDSVSDLIRCALRDYLTGSRVSRSTTKAEAPETEVIRSEIEKLKEEAALNT